MLVLYARSFVREETKISRSIENARKYSIYSSYNCRLRYSTISCARNILGRRKDIGILPISIRVGDIIAPFSSEKTASFQEHRVSSVSEKSNGPYVRMYSAHVADITMSFCEPASTKFNFPFHELDCDWLFLLNSRAPSKFCWPLYSLLVITRFVTQPCAVYWYPYWISMLSSLLQFNFRKNFYIILKLTPHFPKIDNNWSNFLLRFSSTVPETFQKRFWQLNVKDKDPKICNANFQCLLVIRKM